MLKKIVNIRLSAANWLILSFLTVLATACSISYKFNGASIDYTKVKTITIRDFTNQAPYVNPTLAPQFTEDLKDIYIKLLGLNMMKKKQLPMKLKFQFKLMVNLKVK